MRSAVVLVVAAAVAAGSAARAEEAIGGDASATSQTLSVTDCRETSGLLALCLAKHEKFAPCSKELSMQHSCFKARGSLDSQRMFPPGEHYPVTLHRVRHGTALTPLHDLFVGRSLELYGEWSEPEVELFAQILGENSTAIDVGANIGAMTVPLAKMVGRNGAVFAFEPQRILFQVLNANVALNGLSNVWAFPAAVGKPTEPGESVLLSPLILRTGSNMGAATVLDDEGQDSNKYEAAQLVALDEYLPMFPSAVGLIKVDINGHEKDVLEGARRIIERDQPFLYVENDAQTRDLLDYIAESFGYGCRQHQPKLFNADNYNGVAENFFGEIASINIVCAPFARMNIFG